MERKGFSGDVVLYKRSCTQCSGNLTPKDVLFGSTFCLLWFLYTYPKPHEFRATHTFPLLFSCNNISAGVESISQTGNNLVKNKPRFLKSLLSTCVLACRTNKWKLSLHCFSCTTSECYESQCVSYGSLNPDWMRVFLVEWIWIGYCFVAVLKKYIFSLWLGTLSIYEEIRNTEMNSPRT